MSYAANLGHVDIVRALHELGATDHAHDLGRAVFQTQISTARMLWGLIGPATGTIGSSARRAPVDVVLKTDSRNAQPEPRGAVRRQVDTRDAPCGQRVEVRQERAESEESAECEEQFRSRIASVLRAVRKLNEMVARAIPAENGAKPA